MIKIQFFKAITNLIASNVPNFTFISPYPAHQKINLRPTLLKTKKDTCERNLKGHDTKSYKPFYLKRQK